MTKRQALKIWRAVPMSANGAQLQRALHVWRRYQQPVLFRDPCSCCGRVVYDSRFSLVAYGAHAAGCLLIECRRIRAKGKAYSKR